MKFLMKTSYGVLLLLLLAGCTTNQIEVEFPYVGDQLVLNGFISPQQVEIRVSKTFSPEFKVPPETLAITTATVEILDADLNLLVQPDHTVDGIFRATALHLPTEQTYLVRVSAPDFTTVVTDTIFLPAAPVINNFVRLANQNTVEFTLTDATGSDYYSFVGTGYQAGRRLNIDFNNISLGILEESCEILDSNPRIFSDVCLSEQQINLRSTYFPIGNAPDPDSISVRIGKVSADLFKYLLTLDQPQRIEQAFSEPRALYSNVNGGFGMVYGKSELQFEK